ncbi:MAG: NfeD family protein [Lachnospiraceae bacterium]|nr:NfeD family protein [Cuneatibacter sp.]MDD6456178.1 NfeD family protein [Lachnospiraceae bacterium]
MDSIVWLGVLILMILLELATMGLTTIWFAGGALAAFIAALCGASLLVELGLFLVVSFLLLFAFRPLAMRYVNSRTVKTNVESLAGKTARVTEEINNEMGQGTAVLNGQEWTARSADDTVIPAGSLVVVDAVSGVKLLVHKKENGGNK